MIRRNIQPGLIFSFEIVAAGIESKHMLQLLQEPTKYASAKAFV